MFLHHFHLQLIHYESGCYCVNNFRLIPLTYYLNEMEILIYKCLKND